MEKNYYDYPKSSFLALQKDNSAIINKFLGNSRLLKLIYYTSKDWKEKPDLTTEQITSLFDNRQISLVPTILVDKEKYNYIRITNDVFTPNANNDFYRDRVIEIRVICHFDNWDLGDFDLRPYRIAGEIDSMLNGARFAGIGKLQFIGANQDVYDAEFGGVTLQYLAINGNEDKKNPLTDD